MTLLTSLIILVYNITQIFVKDKKNVVKYRIIFDSHPKKIAKKGSRARNDVDLYSDVDVLVVLDKPINDENVDYVSDCTWEAGFEHGIIIVPVVFGETEWENSPERYSLLAKAVETEGVAI